MNTNEYIYNELGLAFWPILFPKKNIDLHKWSIIACDQFTADTSYWKDVEKIVGDSPSTLHCVYPEVYLSEEKRKRIAEIQSHMKTYIETSQMESLPPGCMSISRTTKHTSIRRGIVLAVDLEKYDFTPGSNALIRATENTIIERIPPRVEIRKDAMIEFPHILVLYSDPENSISKTIDSIIEENNIQAHYSTELMKQGGSITGHHIHAKKDMDLIADCFQRLKASEDHSMLFAVGDGNHSLATAKTIWNELKQNLSAEDQMDHPARFALVELVNLYDKGLGFEPIHRVLFKTDPATVLDILNKRPEITLSPVTADIVNAFSKHTTEGNLCYCVAGTQYYSISFKNMESILVIGELQRILDEENLPGELDYIHGFDETVSYGKKPNAVSFLLPPIDPDVLLTCVETEGVLPRKTFSLGHAEEKRYYMEGKFIKKFPGGNL